jgi:hypothetical protein
MTRLEVNDNPVEWFRSDHPVRQDAELLDRNLSGSTSLNLALEGDAGTMFAPRTALAVHHLAADLDALPQVGSVADYTRIAAEDPMLPMLVTQDGSSANVWLRLRGGDNRATEEVVDRAEQILARSGLPEEVSAEWAGQAFVNLTWQQQMVSGMTKSFLLALGTLLLVLMTLFRSVRWGLAAVLPVLGTVLALYGGLGWLKVDFDMPMAVLSSLALGIGVDFAIHFVSRYRSLLARLKVRRDAVAAFMEEPGRALTRNALIIAGGFLPLLLADLVPYVLVGVLLTVVMALSWVLTMTVLPALVVGSPEASTQNEQPPKTPVEPRSAGLVRT